MFSHESNDDKEIYIEVIEDYAQKGDFEVLEKLLQLLSGNGTNMHELAQHFERKIVQSGQENSATSLSVGTDYRKIVALLLPFCKNKESIVGEGPTFAYDYNRQIVIDFDAPGNNGVARAFKLNWDRGHANNPCVIIDANDFLEGKERLKFGSDDVVRIYINAHCNAGLDFIRGGQGKDTDIAVHYEKMAERLNEFVGKSEAVVNLISCAAGRGSRNTQMDELSMASFASKLHHSLALKADRDIPVVARAHVTWVREHRTDWVGIIQQELSIYNDMVRAMYGDKKFGGKSTADLNLTIDYLMGPLQQGRWVKEVHHQPGSKLIFIMNADGEQMVIDAYTYSWKEKVIKELILVKSKTVVEEKKELIDQWLVKFEKMTPKEIYDVISLELNNPASAFAKHKPGSPARFFVVPTSFRKLQILIKEAEPHFDSKFTIIRPMLTGRVKK